MACLSYIVILLHNNIIVVEAERKIDEKRESLRLYQNFPSFNRHEFQAV